jgi:hypothetical protein
MKFIPIAKPTTLAARLLCLSLAITAAQAAHAASPSSDNARLIKKLEQQNAMLEKQLANMQQQVQNIQRQLATMQQQASGTPAPQHEQDQQQLKELKAAVAAASAQAAQASQQVAEQAAAQTAKSEAAEKLSLWGYGEAYYVQPTHDHGLTQADLARAVFGIGYQFDDKTRFNSEFEVEHAVSSASDIGEFEVEQFYIDHQMTDSLNFKAGLFLMPAGFLNENHEPTNYYGVQRNFVETLIIPSTWREGGIALHGNTENGFEWQAGLTTGLDLSKWSFITASPPYRTALDLENNGIAPMQATHQELSLTNASHLSEFAALNYRGVPGLTVGGSYFTGGVVPALPSVANDERVALWETHARYQPGKLDLEALYARGSLSNTAAANAANSGANNPIPARFDGWLLQAAYNVWQSGGYRLSPFVRHEMYDMGADYEGLSAGMPVFAAGSPVPHDTVDTIGANFYLNPNVVFKIDYQKFRDNNDFSRLDLGMGLQF